MNYNPYTESELYQIIHNTRDVSSNPYSLFVAYVLYALFEHLDEEFEFENEDDHYEEYWKTDISHKEFWDILGNAAEDFVSAVENHLQVDINGKAYTIRHTDQFDKSKLKYVFLFNQHAVNGMCPVRKEYIFNVSGEERKTFKEIQSDAKLNKAYFWKIVYAVDKLGKYDDLTDIEAATYCFGLYYSKHVSLETDRKYMLKFMDEYEEYFGLTLDEVISCVIDNLKFPQYYYNFSADKIRKFNESKKQASFIDTIIEKEAEDYWYDVASKGRFKEKS